MKEEKKNFVERTQDEVTKIFTSSEDMSYLRAKVEDLIIQASKSSFKNGVEVGRKEAQKKDSAK